MGQGLVGKDVDGSDGRDANLGISECGNSAGRAPPFNESGNAGGFVTSCSEVAINEVVIESAKGVLSGGLSGQGSSCVDRLHEEHGSDADFGGIGSATSVGTRGRHSRGSAMHVSTCDVITGVTASGTVALEHSVFEDEWDGSAQVVAHEDTDLVVERRGVPWNGREHGRQVSDVDVIGVIV